MPKENARLEKSGLQNKFSLSRYFEAIDKNKWLLPPAAIFLSAIFISKYLWSIGHPELFLDSLSNPTNILIWLTYISFTFLILALSFVIPSISFALNMQVFPQMELDKPALAKTIAITSAFCFGTFLASLILLVAGLKVNILTTISISFTISFSYLLRALPKRNPDLTLILIAGFSSEKKLARLATIINLLIFILLINFTAMCSLFLPAEIILKAWHGAEEGFIAGAFITATLAALYCYLFPAIIYYTLPQGSSTERLKYSALVMAVLITLNSLLMPGILDIWALGTANLLKVRDNRIFQYSLKTLDYPPSMFPKDEWGTKIIGNSYSITGFRQFKFGNILLLCPYKYSNTQLKEISNYAKKCITVSSDKISPITEIEPPIKQKNKIELRSI